MRKFRISSLILAFALIISAIGLGASPVFAETGSDTGYMAFIDDSGDFLTDEQEEDLMTLLNQLTDYGNAVIVTTTYHYYDDTESFAWDYYRNYFGDNESGVIFVIDRCLNQIYLVSAGDAQKKISSARCRTITDNTYVYATSKHDYDYYTCCYKTFDQVLTLYKGGRIAQPMKYITNALMAIIVAMILNFLLAMLLSKSKTPSINQILSGVFHSEKIMDPNVEFIRQDRRYSPRSSGSSSSGGSGGGGGHSGGGHSI